MLGCQQKGTAVLEDKYCIKWALALSSAWVHVGESKDYK